MKKTIQTSESFLLTLFLTLSGGFMDAYSYICRDQVFANAQTGNMLLFGVNLSMGHFGAALRYAFPVVAFSVGIMVAEAVRMKLENDSKIHWRQYIVFGEALILFSVGFLPQDYNLLANSLISLACGAQVQSFRKVHGHAAATTMCIGNLRTGTHALTDYIIDHDEKTLRKGLLFFLVISIFVSGAVLGNFCVLWLQEQAIFVSSLLMLISFSLMFKESGLN